MTKRRAYFWATIVVAGLLALAALTYKTVDVSQILPASVTQPGYYRVTEVHDGDTVSVDMNGHIERVRMIGVDTPETHHPSKPVQCYGPEASDYTKKLLGGAAVRLEADPTNQNRDRYDRLLRYVYTDQNMLVNKALIEQGYGFAYLSFPFQKSNEFAQAEQVARDNKLGLWSTCQPTLNDGRWLSN